MVVRIADFSLVESFEMVKVLRPPFAGVVVESGAVDWPLVAGMEAVGVFRRGLVVVMRIPKMDEEKEGILPTIVLLEPFQGLSEGRG